MLTINKEQWTTDPCDFDHPFLCTRELLETVEYVRYLRKKGLGINKWTMGQQPIRWMPEDKIDELYDSEPYTAFYVERKAKWSREMIAGRLCDEKEKNGDTDFETFDEEVDEMFYNEENTQYYKICFLNELENICVITASTLKCRDNALEKINRESWRKVLKWDDEKEIEKQMKERTRRWTIWDKKNWEHEQDVENDMGTYLDAWKTQDAYAKR